VIGYLVNKARPFIYTTAPAPVCAAVALKAIQIIQQEPDRRKRLQDNAAYLHRCFQEMNVSLGQSTTQVIPLIVGSSEKALALAEYLDEKGFFALAIRPPTVPQGTARVRISAQSDHTPRQLENLCTAVGEFTGYAV